MTKWAVLGVLAAAQFLMVLDQAVMNVAISQLVEDFDTTVTTIQMVIAFYALVMAGLMLTGGKLGDIWGRRRAFTKPRRFSRSPAVLTAGHSMPGCRGCSQVRSLAGPHVGCWRRAAQITAATARAIRWGQCRGARLRSLSPSRPPSSKREIHL